MPGNDAEASTASKSALRANASKLQVEQVSPRLQAFAASNFSEGADRMCLIRALEAGGGGDCLFHSIAAGLAQMVLHLGDDATNHVSDRVQLQELSSSSSAVRALRQLSASATDRWHPEAFLDYMVNRSLAHQLGDLQDLWNPTQLLMECGFEAIVGCESVLAFGDAPDGEPGDAVIRIARTEAYRGGAPRQEELCLLVDGWTKLEALRSRVKVQIFTPGNTHWGDQFDVQNLSDVLDIGILMFCDRLQNNGGSCLYNIGSQRDAFPYWMALWWDEPTHFRLAQISYANRTSEVSHEEHQPNVVSCWHLPDLPPALLQQYKACNRLAN